MAERNKYREQLNEVQYVTSHANPFLLPFRIFVAVPKAFAQALHKFLLSRKLNNEYGVSTDPDGDSVWLYKRN